MALKKIQKITNKQIAEKGVQALADRPNLTGQYGASGLSATQLKAWFDKLAIYLAEKVNEVATVISSEEAANYIRICLDEYGIDNFGDLVTAFTDGTFASSVARAYPSAGSETKQTLQTVINTHAAEIARNFSAIQSLGENKVDKIKTQAQYKRAYIIMPDGTQATVLISETALGGAIPLYANGRQICVAVPTHSSHATNRGYVNEQDNMLGSNVAISIDPNTYVMTLSLKNTSGEVLSTATVDLPLESMILGGSYADGVLSLRIKNTDGHVDDNVINIDISDLIDGLVNISTFNSGVATLNARIDGTNNNLQAFIDEVDLSKIYAHAAFHAEESEGARNFIRGGSIDRRFKKIEMEGGTSLGLSLDTSNYKLTVSLKNRKGEVLSAGTVDLPIESLIASASYANKTLTLKLQSGDTLNINIADIVSGLVPETRTINGKTLAVDIVLTASDVGAYSKSETYSKEETATLIGRAKQELTIAIDEKEVVGYAYMSSEAEKASGFIIGGAIDRQFKKIEKRLSALEIETNE